MWEVMWKCMLAGVVVGGTIGLLEKHGNANMKSAATRVGSSIDSALDEMFSPTRPRIASAAVVVEV